MIVNDGYTSSMKEEIRKRRPFKPFESVVLALKAEKRKHTGDNEWMLKKEIRFTEIFSACKLQAYQTHSENVEGSWDE